MRFDSKDVKSQEQMNELQSFNLTRENHLETSY